MVRLLRPRCRRFPLLIKTRVLIGLEDQLATNRYWWAELSLCRFTSTPSFGEPSVLLRAARFPVNWVKEELFVQADFSLAKIRNRLIRARFSRTVGIRVCPVPCSDSKFLCRLTFSGGKDGDLTISRCFYKTASGHPPFLSCSEPCAVGEKVKLCKLVWVFQTKNSTRLAVYAFIVF